MKPYERVARLPVRVDAVRLEGCERQVGFVRKTTTVCLSGGGAEGRGEDVTYDAVDHDRFRESAAPSSVLGTCTLGELSDRLDGVELFPEPPGIGASRNYRRWAFESAALDLALRQAATNLPEVLEMEARPLRFVVSTGLGSPPTLRPVRELLRAYPELRFKLDPDAGWGPELIGALADADVVDVLDFKGAYVGTPVDTAANPSLASQLAERFPEAVLEDPHLDDTVQEALLPHRPRVSWDAIIHAVADIEALPFLPRWINMKPSRFGTIARLLEAYEWCRAHGARMYGGGQFELGVGRRQIQLLAALFHPEGPNDVAPLGFAETPPSSGLPGSPMTLRVADRGFDAEAS